jgi:hypothetical protein
MAGRNDFLNNLNNDLPEFATLDEGIDHVMKYMHRYTEDLEEKQFYQNIRWSEIRDDEHLQENILHVFKDNGEYLRILDGDIHTGSWEQNLGGMIIKFAAKHELYEKVFLNENFFILQKHGDQSLRGQRKYFFMAKEKIATDREWENLLKLMFEVHKGNVNYLFLVGVVVIIIIGIIYLSFA